jgi:hypothetical protein
MLLSIFQGVILLLLPFQAGNERQFQDAAFFVKNCARQILILVQQESFEI